VSCASKMSIHPPGPASTVFTGTRPTRAIASTARWIPYKPPQVEKIPTVIGTTLDMKAPGVAEFIVSGKVFILEPVIEGNDTSKLLFILSDENQQNGQLRGRAVAECRTAGSRSRPARQHYARLQSPLQSTLRLYFFATCPLPPIKNRFPLLSKQAKAYTP